MVPTAEMIMPSWDVICQDKPGFWVTSLYFCPAFLHLETSSNVYVPPTPEILNLYIPKSPIPRLQTSKSSQENLELANEAKALKATPTQWGHQAPRNIAQAAVRKPHRTKEARFRVSGLVSRA